MTSLLLCRSGPGGALFCGCTPAGHKRPQALFGVRSAGRVRPSDHPRETHPNISSARKYWGPREYPCRVLRGTGARGPRLRAEKACGPQRRATRPCKPSCKLFGPTIRPPAPAGVSRLCGAAMPNAGAPGRCGTLQHTRCAELPGSLPGTIRASAKARVTPWISLRTSVLPGAWLHHPTPHNLTSFDCAGTPGPSRFALLF